MERDHSLFLVNWLNSTDRKPLVIRGARQVGKTWIIRNLASSQKKQLIEFNFEKRPDLVSLFSSNSPKEILINIAAYIGAEIEASSTILFLDEIQEVPHLLAKLRWFFEEMPLLPVVATGSLLDFTLANHEFSMPVGRISYMYLEPLSFEEFLDATGQAGLRSYLKNYDWNMHIPDSIHSDLIRRVKEYLIVGGMPSAVSSWARKNAPSAINPIHFDLLTTYRDDFAKYSGRLAVNRLDDIMKSVPRQLGNKFVFKNANPEITTTPLKQALDLLCEARVCHRVIEISANGLPLDAEANEKFSKVIMLDCGLCNASLGLSLDQLTSISEISMVNAGGMAEQLVGQLLRTVTPAYLSPSLYYWRREKKGAEAEIDYVIQHENQVIPIEVKAGTTGSLKSLHQFMSEKKKICAVRVNSDTPTICPVQVKGSSDHLIEYDLLSIPFYLIGQLHRLIKSARK